MDTPEQVTRYRPPGLPIVWLVRLLVLVALGISVVLFWQGLGRESLPGCGAGSSCDEVLASPWSKVGPVPVTLLAIVLYSVMLIGLCFVRRRFGWWLILPCAVAALGAAAWFMFVQFAIIGQLCKYCTTVHVCGGIGSIIALLHAPVGRLRILPDDPIDTVMISPRRAAVLGGAALLGVGIMIAVQHFMPAPTVRVTLLENQLPVRIDVRDFPSVGRVGSPVVLAEMFDYTCPHCKSLSSYMKQAAERYGDDLLIVKMPAPLDAACNPYLEMTEPIHEDGCTLAKLSLAVWAADREKFLTMHTWLFDQQGRVTPEQARQHAAALVGEDALAAALADPKLGGRLAVGMTLCEHLGGGLPRVLYKDIRIDGRPNSAADLFELLETHTPLRP